MFSGYYRKKRILLTGHTGFKGAWLALWLKELGADHAMTYMDNEFHKGVYGIYGKPGRRGFEGGVQVWTGGMGEAANLHFRGGVDDWQGLAFSAFAPFAVDEKLDVGIVGHILES